MFIRSCICLLGVALLASARAAVPDSATVYAWYMADQGVLTNGFGNVTNWQNRATSGTPSQRNLNLGRPPVLIAGGQNTNAVVRFFGTNNLFAPVANFGTLTSNRTVVACLRLSGASGFLFDGSTASGMSRAQVRDGSWQAGQQPAPVGNGANADAVTLAAVSGVWQVHLFSFEPLSGGTRVRHSIRNGPEFSYTNDLSVGQGGLIVGQNVGQNLGLSMDLAELVVYDRSLTPAESQEVFSYLHNKWATSVASFQPPPAASVYAWFNESSLEVYGDNYTVSSWSNLGTSATNSSLTKGGRNLTRIVGTPKKLYMRNPDGASIGAVTLDGTAGLWASQADFGTLTSNRTVMVVARVGSGNTQGFLFDSSSYTVGLTRAQVNNGNWQVSVYGVGANGSATAAGSTTRPAVTNAWQVHAFVVSSNGSARTFTHYLDGIPGTAVNPAVHGALGGFILGMNASAAAGIRADVAEALVFNYALDSAERASIESYLSNKWAGVVNDPNPPSPPTNKFVRVFAAGVDQYTCFRIPAIVATTRGTLIAVADGRIGSCGDIPTPLDLVCKRSFDNGATWGPLQVIANYGSNPNDVDTYPFYGATNIPRVASGDAALLVDRTNGRIWTLYDNGGNSSGRKIKLELRYSDDDGAGWSAAIDLEAQNPGIRPAYGEFLAGPGNGIQLTEGPNAGRLIFPVYIYGSPSSSMCICSDDHGATWSRSESSGTGGGEVQMAELPGGAVIASMRDNGFPGSGVRTFSRSLDGGVTWGSPYTSTPEQPAIPDPACQGNIFRLSTTNDSNRSRLLHANAAHPSSRVNMTLRLSYDEGATWPVSNQVYAAGSAYSTVTRLANGDIGLLFEKDPYGSLDYIRKSISEITAGADSLPPYTVWSGQFFSPAQLMNPAISGPAADPDGDDFSNQEEFARGTNPLNSGSPLKLEAQGSQGQSSLHFIATSNTAYVVQSSPQPGNGLWQLYADIAPRPTNGPVTVPFTPTNTQGFFRVTSSVE